MSRIPSRRGGSRRRRPSPSPETPAPSSAPSTTGPEAFLRLRAELDRLFDRFFGPESARKAHHPFLGPGWTPSVDVVDSEGEFTVQAELPGLNPEDIQLSLVGNSLVLSGEKKDEREDREKGTVRSERRYGTFRKVIPIPAAADPEQIRADYDRGILTVHLAKSASRTPKRIRISGSGERPPGGGPEPD